MIEWKNKLYYGDNLDIMENYIPDDTIDLVYLDPPFNSKTTYNILFSEKNGSVPVAQIKAFEDFWQWDQFIIEPTYERIVREGPEKLSILMQALRSFLGESNMMAYLTMMAIRLKSIHSKIKNSGSLYLHCDPTACHYIKLVLDAIFGPSNFKNEIVWKRTSAHNDPKRYGKNIDILLFYTKSTSWIWNQQYKGYEEKYLKRFRRRDSDGRLWSDWDLTAKGLTGGGYDYEYKGARSLWRVPLSTIEQYDREGKLHFTRKGGIRLKRYLDEAKGIPLQALWDDIQPVNSQAKERVGYPTQKPEELLERIILTSSNEGDLILDPFCGCGTTVSVAEQLKRRWVGIDITHLAINLIQDRLSELGNRGETYEVVGVPRDATSAETLAMHDRYQFQWWVLSLIDAIPAGNKKKGADEGVDGYLFFLHQLPNKYKKAIVQVKSGKVSVSQIRDLKGTMQRENADIGIFITLREATDPMRKEAKSAGLYSPDDIVGGEVVPKVQIITIDELLSKRNKVMLPTLSPQVGTSGKRRGSRSLKATPFIQEELFSTNKRNTRQPWA